MKIIAIHGDDEKSLYERLQKFINTAKERSWEIVTIGDSNLSFQESLTVESLFANEKFYILRDVSKLKAKDLEWFKEKNKEIAGNLIIYNEGYLTKKILDSLPKIDKIEEFKLPKIIFTFLDSFYPGNVKKILEQLHKLAETEAVEMVFALLSKHLRDLYWALIDNTSLPYPSWRVGKLKSQASKFKESNLKKIIKEFSLLDVQTKTSKTELLPSLDLIVIKHLE